MRETIPQGGGKAYPRPDSRPSLPRARRYRAVGSRGCGPQVEERAIWKAARRARAATPHGRACLTFILARISNAAPQRALTDARPDGSSASTQFPDHGASLPRPSGKPQRRRAPVLQRICPLPAHGRATSRMKKIKQPQHQRTKKQGEGSRPEPFGVLRRKGGPGPCRMSARRGGTRGSQLPVFSEPSWTKAGLAAGVAGRFGSCSFSTLNTRSAMGLDLMKSS